ncbi:hypothetical protein [Streptomyces sp. NPDC005438]|uniref:hypothetical protein n=1 Tax=Streptomyces sp. NPDC005438 TaxID=3156880 RepID=UPI0033B76675
MVKLLGRSRTGPRSSRAEAGAVALWQQRYARLVRLAYLVQPPGRGRHHRVLAAHRTVRRALPGARDTGRRVPAQRGGAPTTDPHGLRDRVLKVALAERGRARHGLARLTDVLRGPVPVVRGVRMATATGGADELALERARARLSAPERAALALLGAESYTPRQARESLRRVGVADAESAVRRAEEVLHSVPGAARVLRESGEYDAGTVLLRPSDPASGRPRLVLALLACAAVAVTLAALLVPGDDPGARRTAASGAAALNPDRLVRAPASAWADSSRVDFTVWPARGERRDDRRLLARALRTWADRPDDTRVTVSPGTPDHGPATPPQLLYAGEVEDTVVVLFHDGQRTVRYVETARGARRVSLDIARVDGADVTTAAALVVRRTGNRTRYLTAPWIAEAGVRDLLRPDTPARDLDRSRQGITAPVPSPPGAGDCSSWLVLQLRSSTRIVEDHSFLLTDLGELSPVHLTHTPPPGEDHPARQPREATSGPALESWAHSACSLGALRGEGTRAVNHWVFARQKLPKGAGRADWVCDRADTWRGRGEVTLRFRPPSTDATEPGRTVDRRRGSALCGRFGQHVLAAAEWRAPSGGRYLLAAGSRAVREVTAGAPVRADSDGPTLAERTDDAAKARVTARVRGGGTLTARVAAR